MAVIKGSKPFTMCVEYEIDVLHLKSFSSLFDFSLQVQWDEPTSIARPDRVSPWEIEPFGSSAPLDVTDTVVKNKKPRPSIEIPNHGKRSFF